MLAHGDRRATLRGASKSGPPLGGCFWKPLGHRRAVCTGYQPALLGVPCREASKSNHGEPDWSESALLDTVDEVLAKLRDHGLVPRNDIAVGDMTLGPIMECSGPGHHGDLDRMPGRLVVPTADIVVTDDIGERACAIQVKTRRQLGSDGGWHMKAKHEGIRGASLFYVFLSSPNDVGALPDAFVVPSGVVAEVLHISQQTWLARLGRKG